MGSASRTTTTTIFQLRHENRSVLVPACLCLTESRSHGNTKINSLIKRLEKAWDSRLEGEVALADVGAVGDCDIEHACVQNGERKCCPHPASVPGSRFICCDEKWAPTVCATSEDACMS